ncbi:MAG TPA: hypothetical protein VHT91_03935 [Kofleriaceae bacterium]|jgi:hypothetical protein|nr:hypothetical protein [Kofleriaceae bacterium]
MADWVLAAERAYVAAAVGPATAASTATAEPGEAAPRVLMRSDWLSDLAAPDRRAHALAAAGAVASRYLAVGTPRSFGLVIDDAAEVDAAALSLAAHRTWFAPRDIRCAAVTTGAAELAAATSGHVVSLDEALACDIVNVYTARIHITPMQLRRGTHVNAIAVSAFDPELLALATVVPEAGLPALAAGLVDGRQLDELTVFTISDSPSLAKIDRGQVP